MGSCEGQGSYVDMSQRAEAKGRYIMEGADTLKAPGQAQNMLCMYVCRGVGECVKFWGGLLLH